MKEALKMKRSLLILATTTLFFETTAESRADFLVSSPGIAFTGESAYGYIPTYASFGNPTTYSPSDHSYSFNSGTGFSGAGAAAMGISYAVSATSFTGYLSPQSKIAGSNSDATTTNQYFAGIAAYTSQLEVTIDKPSVATVTYNPSMIFGNASINTPASANAVQEIDAYVELYGLANNAFAIVSAQSYQYFSSIYGNFSISSLTGSSNT